MTPLTEWPAQYQAGTTLKVRRRYTDFPAPTWTAKAYFQGKSKVMITATADGDAHLFTITPDLTDSELLPGVYQLTEIMALGADRYPANEVMITVAASAADAAGGSLQLAIEKELEAIEARIAERTSAGGDMEEFSVADRHARLVELEKLWQRRADLLAELRRVAAGGTFSRTIVFEFSGTGLRH